MFGSVCFCLTGKDTTRLEIVSLYYSYFFLPVKAKKPNLSFKWVVLTHSFGVFVTGGSSQTKLSSQVSQIFHFPAHLCMRNEK